MKRLLFDTAVFLYARGGKHPYREPCRALLRRTQTGDVVSEASVEVVQEFVHVRLRRGGQRSAVMAEARAVAAACRLHRFDQEILTLSLVLLERHIALDARDAVHAATALTAGIEIIVSPDRAFDDIVELRRVDPLEATLLD